MNKCLICKKPIIQSSVIDCHIDTISITTSLYFTLSMISNICVDCFTDTFLKLRKCITELQVYNPPMHNELCCCLCKEELTDTKDSRPQQKKLIISSLITNLKIAELYYNRSDICVKCEKSIIRELQHLCGLRGF